MELRMTYLVGKSSKSDHYDRIIYGHRSKSWRRVLRPDQNPFCDPPFTKGVQYYHDEDSPQLMNTCFRPYEYMDEAERIAVSRREECLCARFLIATEFNTKEASSRLHRRLSWAASQVVLLLGLPWLVA